MLHEPPTNASTSVKMFDWLNSTVDNFLFPGIIFVTWIIIFVKQMTNPGNTVSKSFTSASFITMILSVFGRLLGYVDTSFMTICIILTVIGGVWMHIEGN